LSSSKVASCSTSFFTSTTVPNPCFYTFLNTLVTGPALPNSGSLSLPFFLMCLVLAAEVVDKIRFMMTLPFATAWLRSQGPETLWCRFGGWRLFRERLWGVLRRRVSAWQLANR